MKLAIFTGLLLASTPLPVFAAKPTTAEAVAELDAAVASALAKRGTPANDVAPDGIWVRRAYLDLIGRIPTADEAESFIKSNDAGKRDALITELLDSPGRASHDFSFWSDVLRVPSRVQGQNGASVMGAYINWLRGEFAANRPYDELVTSLITASGFAGNNPAVGFTLRDRGMPLDHMSATVETFLGTQMLCAQCHDHPYGEWTQQDFYKLAAFSYGMKDVRIPTAIEGAMREEAKKQPKGKGRKFGRQANLLFAPLRDTMVEETTRELKLPDDYQYDDGKAGDKISPQTPFGADVVLGEGESRVEAYASWMTSPENPRFAKVAANRLWKRLFGVGVLEPVTDFDREDEAFSPELLETLGKLLVDYDFDMRAFTRVLANSDLYSRAASPLEDPGDFAFTGPALRRMTAEQVWDSMVTLATDAPEDARPPTRGGGYGGNLDAGLYSRLTALDPNEIWENSIKMGKLVRSSGEDLAGIRKKVERAVALKNEGDTNAAKLGRAATAELASYTGELYGELASLMKLENLSDVGRINGGVANGPRQLARTLATNFPESRSKLAQVFPQYKSRNKRERDKEVEATKKRLAAAVRKIRKTEGVEAAKAFVAQKRKENGKRGGSRFARAAYLPQPAPDGHFLRIFGQSDRESSSNGNTDATVPQALALLNGEMFLALQNPGSKVRKVIDAELEVPAKADAIYLSILGRYPGADERPIVEAALGEPESRAEEDVIWALLNSPQFLFVE